MSAATDVLLAVKSPEMHQSDIAEFYAMALVAEVPVETNWYEINTAIMNRWSLSGLKRIKRLAWKLVSP